MGRAVMMSALPRRVLLLIGGVLVLLAAVGWSSTRGRPSQARADSWHAGPLADPPAERPIGHLRSAPALAPARAHTALASIAHPPPSVPLADGWQWVADPHNLGIAEDWGQGGGAGLPWSPVSIPNDYNAAVSSTSDTGTVAWYQVSFTGPAITRDRAWRVAFEGVRRNAQVWLNGYKIGSNSDPYAPFSLAATTLKPHQPNVLIVRVDNIRGGGSLPEDWWNWGGIMGPVRLEPVGRLDLKDLGVTSQLGCRYRCGSFVVRGTVVNRSI